MTNGDQLMLFVVGTLFFVSAILSLAETAFVRTSRIRMITLAEEGVKSAERMVKMLERPERTLNAVLFLLLVSQMTAATLLGLVLEGQSSAAWVIVGTVGEVALFFVFAEVAPKTYAIQHSDKAALKMSGLLYAITRFPPLRTLSQGLITVANIALPGKGLKEGPFVTEEEIRTMADVAADEQVIEREERRLIHSIFEFGDTVVREVMVPRTDMIALASDNTVEGSLDAAIQHGFSRLPVYQEHTDNIVGLVYMKDLVRASQGLLGSELVETIMRPAAFVPETKRVAELLREMQAKKFHMAVVIDEHGGTAGLVTLEDLLEEIVGEITDEFDIEQPKAEELPDGSLRVAGRMPIDEVNEVLGVELPDDEWDTVGGLVFTLLGHVPVVGEEIAFRGMSFLAEEVQGHRIVSVRITRAIVASERIDETGNSGSNGSKKHAPGVVPERA